MQWAFSERQEMCSSVCVCECTCTPPLSLFRPLDNFRHRSRLPLFCWWALLFLFWQHTQIFTDVHKQSPILLFQVKYQENMAHLGECKWTHVFPFLVVGIHTHAGVSSTQRSLGSAQVFANIYELLRHTYRQLSTGHWDQFPFNKTLKHLLQCHLDRNICLNLYFPVCGRS